MDFKRVYIVLFSLYNIFEKTKRQNWKIGQWLLEGRDESVVGGGCKYRGSRKFFCRDGCGYVNLYVDYNCVELYIYINECRFLKIW